MKFGVFDHMDRGHVPLADQYENRLKLIEAYERAGFYAYHLAEHHGTPLGMAPSPGVFLAAVAQRTRRLRFSALVHCLPMYHPLRIAEEICMLDQLSRGRIELGVGRGISPIELKFYGLDPEEAQARYIESLEIILKALSLRTLTFEGKYYTFRDVPMELTPVQKPHPPLWYGIASPDSVAWAARNSVNVVANLPAPAVRPIVERYRAEWRALGRDPDAMPLVGMNRHLVLAESEAEALSIARRAFARWHASFFLLWKKHGMQPARAAYPDTFDQLQAMGLGLAGTPEQVCETLLAQVREAGNNYLVCRLAFGDLTLAESMRSLDLFARVVMPALTELKEAAE
jgi:alkanesulfonate monooxygenase SsuD/methylene tetrahydromethanopterin reductase-like flavin-dependent oxidoreductase (luciferase family)